MDEAVDQVMGRSQDEKGADKAVTLRRVQQKERGRLITDITTAQQKITLLNEERAPIAAEVRKVEAEVGPIKYIAQFVYGETNEGLLEKAVTWVIIILIVVFDPLAVILLLSSQISFQDFREREDSKPDYEPDDGPLTDQQIEQITGLVDPHPPGWMYNTTTTTYPSTEEEVEELKNEFDRSKHAYLDKPFVHFENLKPMVYTPSEPVVEEPVVEPIPESLFVQNEEQKESNLWSTTTAENITPEEYMKALMEKFEQEPKIAKLAIMVRTGRMDINSIPEDIREEVRKKI
jgi:hypothetical protein